MSDIQEEQKRLYKRAKENDIKFKNLDELDDIEEMRKRYKNLLSCLDKTIFENKELQDRINKAVEYINEMCHKCHKYSAEYNQTYCEFCLGISKLKEHKIPEKLEICYSPDIEEEIFYEKGNKPNHYVLGDAGNKLIISKINEILDYLEKIE